MQRITTFLTFDHQAEEAAKFYTSIFRNSKILATSYYPAGGPAPEGSVCTVEFELDGQHYMALNGGSTFTFSQGISLFVSCETQAEIDEYWSKLLAGGGKEVACGWLTDKFGVSWQVAPVQIGRWLTDKDKTKVARTFAEMMTMTKLDLPRLQRAFDGK